MKLQPMAFGLVLAVCSGVQAQTITIDSITPVARKAKPKTEIQPKDSAPVPENKDSVPETPEFEILIPGPSVEEDFAPTFEVTKETIAALEKMEVVLKKRADALEPKQKEVFEAVLDQAAFKFDKAASGLIIVEDVSDFLRQVQLQAMLAVAKDDALKAAARRLIRELGNKALPLLSLSVVKEELIQQRIQLDILESKTLAYESKDVELIARRHSARSSGAFEILHILDLLDESYAQPALSEFETLRDAAKSIYPDFEESFNRMIEHLKNEEHKQKNVPIEPREESKPEPQHKERNSDIIPIPTPDPNDYIPPNEKILVIDHGSIMKRGRPS